MKIKGLEVTKVKHAKLGDILQIVVDNSQYEGEVFTLEDGTDKITLRLSKKTARKIAAFILDYEASPSLEV